MSKVLHKRLDSISTQRPKSGVAMVLFNASDPSSYAESEPEVEQLQAEGEIVVKLISNIIVGHDI